MEQKFKVGQKVKVNSGWNIDLPDDLKSGDCVVMRINTVARLQPNIYVQYDGGEGVGCYIYPNPDECRVFDVEILEDVQD